MKTAAIVIDSWKLPVFKRHLEEGKFAFTEHPGAVKDTLTLKVSYEWVAALKPIVDAANEECAKAKR